MTGVLDSVSELLFGAQDIPDLPKIEIPATPAPNRREDTGANIIVGSDNVKDKRASGGGSGQQNSTAGGGGFDVLGNLGKGGLSI